MDTPFYIGTICITPHTSEREVHFSVADQEGYLFRLVPTPDGFSVSLMDQALGHAIDQALVTFVSDAIESHYC